MKIVETNVVFFLFYNEYFLVSPRTRIQPVTSQEAYLTFSSPKEHSQKSLLNHTIRTVIAESANQCYNECRKTRPECMSFNYGYIDDTGLCELNNNRKSDVAEYFFVKRNNFQYFEVV